MSEQLKEGEIYRTLSPIETNGGFTVPAGAEVIYVDCEHLVSVDLFVYIFLVKNNPSLEFGLSTAQVAEYLEGMQTFVQVTAPL